MSDQSDDAHLSDVSPDLADLRLDATGSSSDAKAAERNHVLTFFSDIFVFRHCLPYCRKTKKEGREKYSLLVASLVCWVEVLCFG